MFTRLGRLTVRRRRLVPALTVLFVVAAGAGGAGAFGALEDGGFDDPDSESFRAGQFLEEELGASEPELVLLVSASGQAEADQSRDVDDPAVAEAGADLTESVAAEPNVASAISYWSLDRAAPLRSTDGSAALVVADLTGDDDQVEDAVAAIEDRYAGTHGPITVGLGGGEAIDTAIGEQLDSEIAAATGLSLSNVRSRVTELQAKGAVMLCRSIRYRDGKPIEGLLCRISGYTPPPAPGRKSKAQLQAKSTSTG